MSAQPEAATHQAPASPSSVCWLADLNAYGPQAARDLHPITDAANHRMSADEWQAHLDRRRRGSDG